MTTNGTQPLVASPDILWVSIDGSKETHNRLRGQGVYEQVIENIQSSSHPRVLAHITINAMNVREIPAVIRELVNLVKGFTIQFYYPYEDDQSLLVSQVDRSWVIQEIIKMKMHGYQIHNSLAGLKALEKNTWRCEEWLVDNVNPDGSIQQGCYLKDRTAIHCAHCGFSPFTEMSLTYHLHPSAIMTGFKVFFPKGISW
jgi:MoaA/NifB/PqqE/SkfB family radical SAM enzyme